jgi:hypothetical protein
MQGIVARAGFLLGMLCCCWVACTLVEATHDAYVQKKDTAAFRRDMWYNRNPCRKNLPSLYSGSLAGLDT